MLLNAADKALWRLALPMIFSNITVPLLGLVDTAVIGHLDSPDVMFQFLANGQRECQRSAGRVRCFPGMLYVLH